MIKLSEIHFFTGDNNIAPYVLLHKYCQTTDDMIKYDGKILVDYSPHDELQYKNIVYAQTIMSTDISFQFPNLVSTEETYITVQSDLERVDIGKLKETNIFDAIYGTYYPDMKSAIDDFKQFVKIIDKQTLEINGKLINITEYWSFFGKIHSENYHKYIL